jgi:hypothetical protein
VRANDIVTKLIENDPDEMNARDYVMSTNPWWKSLDEFTQAYIQAALWDTTGPPYGECPCCGREAVLDSLPEPEFEQTPMCSAEGCGVRQDEDPPQLEKNYSEKDIDPATLKQMAEDCAEFQRQNSEDLQQYDMAGREWSAAAQGGHDFWLTRSGSGAGFFDRDNLPEDVRDRLNAAAHQWGNFDLYVGDDGKIYH